MITLNLISPEQKKILKIKQIFLLLRNLTGLILFFTITMAILLILTFHSLSLDAEFNQNPYFNLTYTEKDIRDINNRLKNIYQIQIQHLFWPEVIIPLVKIIPNNVEIKNLDIDKNNQLVKLEGIAKTRNDYLSLITALETEPKIKDLNSPFENLLKKENINFNLTFVYQFNQANIDEKK